MSKRFQVRAGLAAVSLALASAGSGAADAAHPSHIPDPPPDMLELVRAQRVPLVTWAVVVDGSSRSGSIGTGPVGVARPARDVFLHAASVTKPVVATAVMTLVREGRIALDAPVTQYLRDQRFAELGKPAVTIRNLLSHRSGLKNYDRLNWDSRDDTEAGLQASLMEPGVVVREGPPGGEFSYADINYDLLGAVLEAVTGDPFAAVVRTRALRPYGAKSAQLSCLDAPAALLATPHALSNTGEPSASVLRPFSRRHSPSGGLCITAEELARWGASLLDCQRAGAPLDCATFRSMLPQGGAAYGLGWFVEDLAGARLVWHDGSDVGYSAALILVPERHAAIAVLTNFEFASAAPMAKMYAARLLGSASYPKMRTIPAPGSWPQYAGMYFQADLHCAEVLATRAGLEVRYQSPDFPYEMSHVRLLPKPEWDDGYFIGIFRGKLIWFGDLAAPEHSYLFMDSKKLVREPPGSRRCPPPGR